jgi:zinc/manganese transport system substrate-binding protein
MIAVLLAGHAAAQPLSIVAAENFYGDVATQITGSNASVSSIISSPSQDPHLFEANASVARLVAGAAIVVANGADYDPWMIRLLSASRSSRTVIIVAQLVGARPGTNPHIWYEPGTMPTYAKALVTTLSQRDPAHAVDYQQNLQHFLRSLEPVQARISDIRARFHGAAVTASEPVFGYMAAALGLAMRNERFQLAVMNDTEPRASDIAAIETDLRQRRVRVLFHNSQASNNQVARLVRMAEQSGIPAIGISETEPAGTTYQRWMLDELDAVGEALAR